MFKKINKWFNDLVKDTRLLYAVEIGNLPEVIKQIANNANVNYVGTAFGDTALNIATKKGHIWIVKELLKVPNINVNIKDIFGNTVLHTAVMYGRIEIIKELLNVPNIDVTIQKQNGDTPLDIATKKGQSKIIKILKVRLKKIYYQEYEINRKDDIERIQVLKEFQGFDDWWENILIHMNCKKILIEKLSSLNLKIDKNKVKKINEKIVKDQQNELEKKHQLNEQDKLIFKEMEEKYGSFNKEKINSQQQVTTNKHNQTLPTI